ncbi:MAG: oligosaccharide flippase family protein [Acidimicrobiales bacterium]|nr:oligosaccharide flippase family protein [Acidimicrobiales bacterium]
MNAASPTSPAATGAPTASAPTGASTGASTVRPARVATLFGPGAVEMIVFACSLLTGPILSRALDDDGRGSLAAVLVPTQLVGWALALGVPYASAMMTRRVERRALLDGAWGIAILIGIPAAGVLYATAPWLLADHPAVALDWYRIGLIGTVLSMPAATAMQLRLMASGATWGLSAAKSAHLLANSVLVTVLAVIGRLTLSTALASWLLCYLASRIVVLLAMDAFVRGRPQLQLMGRQLVLGRAQAVVTIANISLGRIDQVFLAFAVPSAELGRYAVAATAAQVSLPLARGFADVVLPDAFARDGEDISRRAIPLVLACSTLIGAASAVAAPFVIPALFGAQFAGSVQLLWLLIPGQVAFNTAWVISAKHLGAGTPGVAARAIGGAALLNAVALPFGVGAFGAAGAAALTSVCQAVYLAGLWWGARR